jgi:hypothetical protein
VGLREINISRDNSVNVATGWTAGVRFSSGLRDCFYSTASRLVMGLTQPPIQWVQRALSPVLKRPGHETDHSPPSSAKVKNDGAIPSLPISLHGMVLN